MIHSFLRFLCFLIFINFSFGTYTKQFETETFNIAQVAVHGRGSQRYALSQNGEDFSVYESRQLNGELDIREIFTVDQPSTSSVDKIVFTGDHDTGDLVFIQNNKEGKIYQATGVGPHWSLQALLSSPEPYYPAFDGFDFPSDMAVDFKSNGNTIAVGCKNCNQTGAGAGEIFVYNAVNKANNKFSLAQTIQIDYSTSLLNTQLQLGEVVGIYDDVLVGNFLGTGNIYATKVFARDRNGVWSEQQTLRTPSNAEKLAIYDGTIVVGVPSENSDDGAVHIFTSNNPGPKDGPRRWSQQQTLRPPTADLDGIFGSDISLNEEALIVTEFGQSTAYFYQKSGGRWSATQVVQHATWNLFKSTQNGATAVLGAFATGLPVPLVYSQDADWKCLLVTLEDTFGDTWDVAELEIKTPNGEIDTFAPYCEASPNTRVFRYCPSNVANGGLYKFSVANAESAKFRWEIQWTVEEEATGDVYRGDHTTKMDFHFDSENAEFSRRAIRHELPQNATCHACPAKPQPKGPKASPANYSDWQYFKMESATAEWFSEDYHSTAFYISDLEGKKLISSGTWCSFEDLEGAFCWQNIRDGEYVLRVTGALDSTSGDHSWRFCGKQGGAAQTHLVFTVKNGECAEVTEYSYAEYCTDILDTVVTVSFDIVLSGTNAPHSLTSLSNADQTAITNTIAKFVSGLTTDDITISSVQSVDGNVVLGITLQLSSAAMGYSTRDYSSQEEMVSDFQATIATALGNGKFYSTFMSYVVVTANSAFAAASTISFSEASIQAVVGHVDLPLSNSGSMVKNYFPIQAEEPVSPTVDAQTQPTHNTASVSLIASIVGVVAAVALVVGLVAYAMKSRASRNVESARDIESLHIKPADQLQKMSNVKLNASIVDGLKKMVKDEDEVLAKTLSSPHFTN